jgi:hypothetical protein
MVVFKYSGETGSAGGIMATYFGDSWGIRVVLTMLEGEDIMDNDDTGVFNQNR